MLRSCSLDFVPLVSDRLRDSRNLFGWEHYVVTLALLAFTLLGSLTRILRLYRINDHKLPYNFGDGAGILWSFEKR